MNIVFVCTGNTCRSPMGEGILKKIVSEKKIDNVKCSSAGISAFNGDSVSKKSVEACKEIGIDISDHLAKNIKDIDVDSVDIFVAVTRSHAEFLCRMGIDQQKIYILNNVKDPFAKDMDAYRNCRDKLCEEVNKLWKVIEERLKLSH